MATPSQQLKQEPEVHAQAVHPTRAHQVRHLRSAGIGEITSAAFMAARDLSAKQTLAAKRDCGPRQAGVFRRKLPQTEPKVFVRPRGPSRFTPARFEGLARSPAPPYRVSAG
jgi:hypothetical protein